MALTEGARLGPYIIAARIGAGGMGEVYRARDTRLGRDVALKTLPHAFTTNPQRVARLEREARMLSALNHPNIATLLGIEDHGEIRALVMELVEGRTLDEIIRRTRGLKPLGSNFRMHCPSPGKSLTRSMRRTRRTSSIGISSRRISRSRRTASSKSWTSASPRPSWAIRPGRIPRRRPWPASRAKA